jgi:hypothetical protein
VTGVTRGARLFAIVDRRVHAAIVLDRSGVGRGEWWVALEGVTGDDGHPRTVSVPSRDLHPTPGAAAGAIK